MVIPDVGYITDGGILLGCLTFLTKSLLVKACVMVMVSVTVTAMSSKLSLVCMARTSSMAHTYSQ